MEYDAKEQKKDATIDADICIVGSGAAGLAMAHSLINATYKSGRRIKVVVLESSSMNVRQKEPYPDHHRYIDPTVQPLYAGEMSSTSGATAQEFFLGSRIRCFGGTTNCWGGWTQPLDIGDFNRNTGPGRSLYKWPINFEDLRPHYQRAMGYCSIGTWGVDTYDKPGFWKEEAAAHGSQKIDVLPLKDPRLRSKVIVTMGGRDASDDGDSQIIDGALDFQHLWGQCVRIDPNIDIYRNANVRCIESDTGLGVKRLKVTARGFQGPLDYDFYVTAKRYVLAASCVENTRLLLNSDKKIVSAAGPALGKYLMTHPLCLKAVTFNTNVTLKPEIRNFYGNGVSIVRTLFHPTVFAVLVPTPNAVFTNGSGNFRAWVGFGANAGDEGGINFCWEQYPNAANKIDRSSKKDEFGDNLPAATLNLTSDDTLTIDYGIELVGQALQAKQDNGDIYVTNYQKVKQPDIILTGQHAMGTTRMAASPSEGVVNADCRVHNVHNLYIAGGSVFPTAGWANPTLTMIALALRLSDHLKSLD